MTNNNKFSCFIIGADTLLIECGQLLLAQGHEICGVITSAPRIVEWAKGRALRVVDAKDDYERVLRERPFDHLIAITHLAIIPEPVLALPKRFAVNFHDGPLPRYAGLNAPAWALMQQEAEYAISWHIIEPGIDTGDILLQKPIEIAPGETSLSLNTKCFEAGIESFGELLELLSSQTYSRKPQDRSQRSYYGRHDRPRAAAVLDFNRPASELEALVRALDFGPYANSLSLPKLCHRQTLLAVVRAEALPDVEGPRPEPGTLLSIEENALIFQTRSGRLSLNALATLTGEAVPLPEALQRFGLNEGEQLESVMTERLEQLDALHRELAPSESFWQRALERLEPVELPIATAHSHANEPNYQSMVFAWPESLQAFCESSEGSKDSDRRRNACILGLASFVLRTAQKQRATLSYSTSAWLERTASFADCFATRVPLSIELNEHFSAQLEQASAELTKLRKHKTYSRDLIARIPALSAQARSLALSEAVVIHEQDTDAEIEAPSGSLLCFVVCPGQCRVIYDAARIPEPSARAFLSGLESFLSAIFSRSHEAWREFSLLSPADRERILVEWNQTSVPYRRDVCVHELIAERAKAQPGAVALSFEDQSLSYAELDRRTNQLAAYLREHGVGPDQLVGVSVERSLELVIAALAVQKAGGAYVPLDPDYPIERIRFMLEDSGAQVLLTQQQLVERFPSYSGKVVRIDADWSEVEKRSTEPVNSGVTPENLAYVIYTSGSTGTPKGVMVEHRNVVNFFTGMDPRISHEPPGTWLAVTSLSFDISVLELFWTLSRGFHVVVYLDRARLAATQAPHQRSPRRMDFGLFYWGNDDGQGPSKYELLLEGAKIADRNGFNSVWTPERHFHAFGGPYPNPAVTGAAVAAVTSKLDIRAGSCVVPLHHPIRVAEEWAVVDNLSNGRVGLSLASGWQPDDFVLRPENAPPLNKAAMFRDIETVRSLWRGESVEFENANGKKVQVVSQPRPVQPELPIWVTTAGNPDTYKQAAKLGANVLTHLLGQSIAEVGDKIRIYRDALETSGRPRDAGKVTLMLHTFVGADRAEVKRIVREPMREYLRSATALIKQYAWAFPAFKRPENVNTALDVDLQSLSEEELDAILEFAFERYFEDSGLFGTVEECLKRVEELKAIGVDEIACLIDYGVETPKVLEMLSTLSRVVAQANPAPDADRAVVGDFSLPALIQRHGVTHLQCTPSMARMLSSQPEAREALRQVEHLMIGGEAFPAALVDELSPLVGGSITNMYGPTETTIWSSTQRVEAGAGNLPTGVPIGRPIANTQLYVLDAFGQPLPVGVPGELYIGGDGVVRGYLNREALTKERFVPDPFRKVEGARLYRTGDLARLRADGVLEFLGRTDHQVKVRGYRIELGEIETWLGKHPQVREAVVIAREDTPGDQRLVAYWVPTSEAPQVSELRSYMRAKLPEYMVPSAFVLLKTLPLTPNGKVDRKQLKAPEELEPKLETAYVPPSGQLERTLAGVWSQILGREKIGIEENFFDLGGHSLLVVRMHRELKQLVEQPISLTDLYRFPTIRSLSSYLSSDGSSELLQQSTERAQRRREAMQRRRRP